MLLVSKFTALSGIPRPSHLSAILPLKAKVPAGLLGFHFLSCIYLLCIFSKNKNKNKKDIT